MTSKEKALLICEYLSSKKAKGIVYIAVENKTSLCDYFIIAGGSSKTQVKSLAENLEEKFEKDIEYIEKMSFWFDLKVIFMTIKNKNNFVYSYTCKCNSFCQVHFNLKVKLKE